MQCIRTSLGRHSCVFESQQSLTPYSYWPVSRTTQFSFQTPDKIYLVLDYINGGELFFHLQNEGVFRCACVCLYLDVLLYRTRLALRRFQH